MIKFKEILTNWLFGKQLFSIGKEIKISLIYFLFRSFALFFLHLKNVVDPRGFCAL
ncbi:hypothetical protein BSM4216_2176 [Bacillus smithii]|nr:hypothetical protein BSM4216_2176 [Bacillus smithii]